MRTIKTEVKRILYSFNFRPEGFNAVWANNQAEAISEAKRLFPSLANQVDETSFKALDTQEKQDAYWNNTFPLLD
jgi:hypothetical protein